jgi:hypothetical protein
MTDASNAEDPILDWYRQLYGDVDEGWLSFFAVDRSTGQNKTEWCRVTDLEAAAEITRRLNADGDVWHGVAIRTHRTSGRGGATECGWITALWADIDFKDPGHQGNDRLPPDEATATELVRRFPIRPTALTHTGGGLQAWYLLDEPVPTDDLGDLLEAFGATWNKVAADLGYHVDNVFDLARIMRPAGSYNRKLAQPRPVTLTGAKWDRRYGISEIRDACIDPPEPTIPRKRNDVPYIGPDRPGDEFAARHDGHELLTAEGFHHPTVDHNGDTHYRAPHRGPKDQSGATVYADGHVTVWSETFCANRPGLRPHHGYDLFGFYVALHHDGDFAEATRDLRSRGYGSEQQNPFGEPDWNALDHIDGPVASPPADDDLEDDETPDPEPEEAKPSTWAPVDLEAALEGLDVDPPVWWQRSDGTPLVYAGRTHWFQGPSESLKSMAAQMLVVEALNAGSKVLYIDFEDDDRGVVARLLSMGATPAAIRELLTYVRPDEALQDRGGKWTPGGLDYLRLLQDQRDVVILDGVTEAMTTEGMDLLDNGDTARWMRLLPKRLADTGAAVVVIDHTTKNAETAGRHAIGAQHKLAGVTGATYKFEVLRPLARAVFDPVVGQVKITVTKDRPGWVRGRCEEGQVGLLEVTSYPDGGLSAALMAPGAETNAVDMALIGEILGHLATYEGATTRSLEESVGARGARVRGAVKAAIGRGWIEVRKVGSSHQHHITDAGREVM